MTDSQRLDFIQSMYVNISYSYDHSEEDPSLDRDVWTVDCGYTYDYTNDVRVDLVYTSNTLRGAIDKAMDTGWAG